MSLIVWRGLLVLVAILLVLTVNRCSSDEGLEVKTPYGTYRGHIIKSRGGRDLLSFKGIPYAQPPVGPLRFKEPMKLETRDGVYDAIQERMCSQFDMKAYMEHKNVTKHVGSEDCLLLNIYRPKEVSSHKLPVYFWIHGGGFMGGSGSDEWNGPMFLLDGHRDMVMVTINYRLGILGFLSANDVNLPGNLGLKDQTMALKWVQENIELFGGDPNSVTIGGISAGAASVGHHLNSKASRGLFHRAISQSGTADCSWASKPMKQAKDIASNLISFLGCPYEPSELLLCLQELPVDLLIKSLDVLKVDKTGFVMYMMPVIEKDTPTAFMTEESVQMGSDVPWLTGVTSEEGIMFFQILGLFDPAYSDLSLLKENYKDVLPVVAYYGPREDDDSITKELVDFYFKDLEFSPETVKNFIQLLSDRMFNHGLHVSASKYKGKLFTYMLSQKANVSFFGSIPNSQESGVSHGEDIIYFFKTNFTELQGENLKLSNTLLDMWYDFIVHGDPTPESHLWEESDGGKKYLDFTSGGPVMASNMFQQRMQFLDKLENKYKLYQDQ